MRLLAISIVASLSVGNITQVWSDELENMAKTVGKMCPGNLATYNLPGPEYCGKLDKCDSRDLQCVGEHNRCLDRLWEVQKQINRYNEWIYKCRDAENKRLREAAGPTLPQHNLGDSPKSDLAQRLQARQKESGAYLGQATRYREQLQAGENNELRNNKMPEILAEQRRVYEQRVAMEEARQREALQQKQIRSQLERQRADDEAVAMMNQIMAEFAASATSSGRVYPAPLNLGGGNRATNSIFYGGQRCNGPGCAAR